VVPLSPEETVTQGERCDEKKSKKERDRETEREGGKSTHTLDHDRKEPPREEDACKILSTFCGMDTSIGDVLSVCFGQRLLKKEAQNNLPDIRQRPTREAPQKQ
jgi:hypothetical protein